MVENLWIHLLLASILKYTHMIVNFVYSTSVCMYAAGFCNGNGEGVREEVKYSS